MLTRLEKKVLEVIRNHLQEQEESPTIAEIAAALDINSRGTVHRYVQSLVKKGQLVRVGNGWRGLRLAGGAKGKSADTMVQLLEAMSVGAQSSEAANTVGGQELSPISLSAVFPTDAEPYQIPVIGQIAAGMPIEALPDDTRLDLSGFFVGRDRYALRVTGDSMIKAGILDGDTVIIRKQASAKPGDIVVALIDQQEATLKRLGRFTPTEVELIPENDTMPVMLYSASRVSIQGVLLGQIRCY